MNGLWDQSATELTPLTTHTPRNGTPFSTATGQKLWTSAPDPNPWGSEASFKESSIANGILYGLETDGVSAVQPYHWSGSMEV